MVRLGDADLDLLYRGVAGMFATALISIGDRHGTPEYPLLMVATQIVQRLLEPLSFEITAARILT